MMTDRDGGNAVDGGLVRHIPVLAAEVLQYLGVRDGGVYIDGTFGAGGYTRAILDAADCRVIGIDRDPSAIAGGADLVASSAGRLTLAEDRFSNLDVVAQRAGQDTVDGVVLDVGVSSMQLDEASKKSNLVAGFVLRCFQHLSNPDLDTRRCTWRHNR